LIFINYLVSERRRHLVEEPFDEDFAPFGWQGRSDGTFSKRTEGNNVRAAKPNNDPPRATKRVFDFPIDFSKEPESYKDACVTQLYFTVNWLHDVFYQHGFDERRYSNSSPFTFHEILYSGSSSACKRCFKFALWSIFKQL
jgi:hypothetical protein